MRTDLDEHWEDTHFAFVANAPRIHALARVEHDARRRSQEAWRARAPSGWAPADEPGLFVPAGPAPEPTAEQLEQGLAAFYETYFGVLLEKAALPDALRASLARSLAEAASSDPGRTLREHLAKPSYETSRVLAERLVHALASEARMLALGAPEIIVESSRAAADDLANALLWIASDRSDRAAEWLREVPASMEDCIELCVEPDEPPLGVGGGPRDLLDALLVPGPMVGSWTLVEGEALRELADACEQQAGELDAFRDEYDEAARDPALEQAPTRAEARVEETRAALQRLSRRARELEAAGMALITDVRRDEGR